MQGHQRSGQYKVPDKPPPKPPRRPGVGSRPTSTETTPQHTTQQPAAPAPQVSQVSLHLKDEEFRKAAVKVSNRAIYNCCAKAFELGLILLLVIVVVLIIVAGSL